MNTRVKLSNDDINFFKENGFLIKKKFHTAKTIELMQSVISEQLKTRQKPFELEQQVAYPGSPKSIDETGGDTIRRLLMAYDRDTLFKRWAQNPSVKNVLCQLFDSDEISLVQTHHNCIMTKQPEYSSDTNWHKDIRYWRFKSSELINTWLPLGNETQENGCLQVLPGSHLWNTPQANLDERLFLRKDLKDNQPWLSKSKYVELEKGDLLFFHAALFHAAGRNHTQISKNALVYTYHTDENQELSNVEKQLQPIKI